MGTELQPERIREFVIAGHGDLDKVKTMLGAQPELLNAAHDWGGFVGDTETALQAAAHVGNQAIAEYLLDQGAPLHITTAAMLNQVETVRGMLEADRGLAQVRGAHRISLMAHAVYSLNTELLDLLLYYGAAMDPQALFAATAAGRADVVAWLIEHGANDLAIRNFRGQTPLELAEAAGHADIVRLLQSLG